MTPRTRSQIVLGSVLFAVGLAILLHYVFLEHADRTMTEVAIFSACIAVGCILIDANAVREVIRTLRQGGVEWKKFRAGENTRVIAAIPRPAEKKATEPQPPEAA